MFDHQRPETPPVGVLDRLAACNDTRQHAILCRVVVVQVFQGSPAQVLQGLSTEDNNTIERMIAAGIDQSKARVVLASVTALLKALHDLELPPHSFSSQIEVIFGGLYYGCGGSVRIIINGEVRR